MRIFTHCQTSIGHCHGKSVSRDIVCNGQHHPTSLWSGPRPLRWMCVAIMLIGCLFSERPIRAADPTERDIEYGRVGDFSLRLDFYATRKSDQPQSPCIVWIHGGAWRSGSKNDMPLTKLLDMGFAVASVDYRLSTQAKFPAQVHDINSAIRFLRSHASRYKIDPKRFVIAGSSAGGHLANLVGVSSDVKELTETAHLDGSPSVRVQAIVSFYGASNLETILQQSTPHGLSVRVPALDLFLGGQPDQFPAIARLASPVAHVDKHDPPLWMYHGDQDPQMPINQSHELEGAYEKLGLPCKLRVIHGAKHGGKEFFTDERLEQLGKELLTELR